MKKLLVIMAAGLGSRYGGVKQIARLGPGDEILMEYAIFDAIKAGFNKIIIIIKQEMLGDVKALFGDRIAESGGVEICYAFQHSDWAYEKLDIPAGRTKPLGTVHAVLSAREHIDGPFAVINADDYYGRSALQAISSELEKLTEARMSTMVAYSLKNTVSRFGTVTRGVCEIENGFLKKVHETYKIKLCEDGLIRDLSGEDGVVLNPDSPVSMNMWGYNEGALELFDAYFRNFLTNLAPDDNKSECLLPVAMDHMISRGMLETSVLSTDEQWFGLTYRDDTPGVKRCLNTLHESGFYPPVLWN